MIPKIILTLALAYYFIHLWRITVHAFWKYHKADDLFGRFIAKSAAANKGAVAVLVTVGMLLGFAAGYLWGAS